MKTQSQMAGFLFLFFVCSVVVDAGGAFEDKKIINLQNGHWKLPTHSSSTCLSRLSRAVGGATILEMKQHDFCSGIIQDWNKNHRETLISDDIHVRSIQSQLKNTTLKIQLEALHSTTQIPLNSGVALGSLNYVVTVELGSQNMTVIVDTGSDLTWVQCQPCKSCYNQQGPIYDSTKSISFNPLLCNSTACHFVGTSCDINTCNYIVTYGDRSRTIGQLGTERIGLGGVQIENFVFGCGSDNRGLFGRASGLMGLGRSSVSLVSQATNVFEGVFSYCLPSATNRASGSLVLGTDFSSYKNSTPISYTKLVQNPMLSDFYVLNLTGISIGGMGLELEPKVIIIDSGTVITRLPPSMYNSLKKEFVKLFSASGYPSSPGYSILDTCFDLKGYEEVTIPTLRLFFEGNVVLEVDATGVLYVVNTDGSKVCLALASIAGEDDVGIIGNIQQRNQRIVYDTKEAKVGIASEDCSFQ